METSAKTAQNVNEIFYEIGMPFSALWYLILSWSQSEFIGQTCTEANCFT